MIGYLHISLAMNMDWFILMEHTSLSIQTQGEDIILNGIVMFSTGGEPNRPINALIAQLIGFLAMTLPSILYFAIFESSSWQASIGKHLVGPNNDNKSQDPESFSFESGAIKTHNSNCLVLHTILSGVA